MEIARAVDPVVPTPVKESDPGIVETGLTWTNVAAKG
jgi:hypothetical protein